MKRTFFIIPGFKQKATDEQFKWLTKLLKSKGFDVVNVPVDWKYRTASDYARDFKVFYDKHRSQSNYVLGFSYGAVIALLTASELRPNKIYLCSLSPDFKEDLSSMTPWVKKMIGKKRVLDIKKRSGRAIAKNLDIPSVLFYGEKEARLYPQLKVRCEETNKLAKSSKLVVVKDAPHRLNHLNYIEAIHRELDSL